MLANRKTFFNCLNADIFFKLHFDDMYISGGENVYPAEIERVLKKHLEIEDTAVVGVPP
jgi:acyl-CoA synthetase (AMP-forming)/AMP-acid ligase II